MSIASFVESTRLGVVQTVALTAASATMTNAISNGVWVIRITANTACHIKVVEGAAGGSAATTDTYLPANWVDEIRVAPGQKVSAIRASTGGLVTATDGTLWVTELSA